MKQSFRSQAIKWIAAAACAFAAPLAMAGGDVSWSVSVGSPYPAPVYAPPPPVVYVQPQPVYVRPRPVYVAPPVVYGPTYYVEEGRHRKHHHHHGGHRHDYRY